MTDSISQKQTDQDVANHLDKYQGLFDSDALAGLTPQFSCFSNTLAKTTLSAKW